MTWTGLVLAHRRRDEQVVYHLDRTEKFRSFDGPEARHQTTGIAWDGNL
jgi:hypothetical protein